MFRNFEKFSLKNWNKEISVGLSGSFLCTKIFGNEMAKKSGGVILNIASDLSVYLQIKGYIIQIINYNTQNQLLIL